MARRGCIRVDSLALQILLNDNPTWADKPVAVTGGEKPQSPILSLNPAARDRGLAPGMKYANALALVPSLRAREVRPHRIAQARDIIVRTVFSFTPDIEPCPFDADATWVSLEGLGSLYASQQRWIEMVRSALASQGFFSVIVAGFTRFGTYAVSRCRRSSLVLASREEEISLVDRSSIDILPLSQGVRGTLRKLGVHTVRQFVSLPVRQTVRRFGREASRLRQAILSDDPLPIPAAAVEEAVSCARRLDTPVADRDLLLPHIRQLLCVEAERADAHGSVISGIVLRLRTEEGERITDLIRPAAPTPSTDVLMRLIALRLAGRHFLSGVEDIEIRAVRTEASWEQGELFASRSRDLQAGARAFAAIRARYGEESVMCARPCDSHLPERSFRWAPLDRPVLPGSQPLPPLRADASGQPAAVRRILHSPRASEPARHKPVDEARPFLASGSWWGTGEADAPFRRAYYYCHSPEGVLWLYDDLLTGTSWVQGWVD